MIKILILMYNVSGKKETKMFFVTFPVKLRRCWWNLVYSFLNKFAANLLNNFHFTLVMSLHYLVKLKMLILHVLPLSFYSKKNLSNLFNFNCCFQIRHLITECEDYCKRRCLKHSSLIWTNCNSDWGRSGWSWIMSLLRQPFVSGVVSRSRSVMRVLYTFSRNSSTRCNQLDSNMANLKATVKVR